MLETIYLLLEITAVIICLHRINNSNVLFNIQTIGFISIEIVFTEAIMEGIIHKEMYFLIYVLYIVYSYLEFSEGMKNSVLSSLLSIAIVALFQMAISIPVYGIMELELINEDFVALTVNSLVLLIFLISRNSKLYYKIYEFCKNKEAIVYLSLAIMIGVMAYCLYLIKNETRIKIDVGIIIITFIICIGAVLLKWQKSEQEKELQKTQLKLASVYGNKLNELVEVTRRKQHEYKNQINALQGMHMTIGMNDQELQQAYYNLIEQSNKTTSILNCVENPILAGFLYKKIDEMLENGLDIDYKLAVTSDELCIEIFDMIEILGILLDNAVEAVKNSGLSKQIFLEVLGFNKNITISVRNVSRRYENDEIAKFFDKNYTTKGKNRGIGLTKIKELQKKYKYDILVQMQEIDTKDWISFSIIKK